MGVNTAGDFLRQVERAGCQLLTDGERVGLRGPADAVARLRQELPRWKADLLRVLRDGMPALPSTPAPEGWPPRSPFLGLHGDLVIPFGTPPELCWWKGGRSILEILDGLNAPAEVRARYEWRH